MAFATRNRYTCPVFVLPSSAGAELSRRGLLAVLAAIAAGASTKAIAVSGPDGEYAPTRTKKGARGSKEAKGYQLCLSQCLYDCTTPKEGPAKARAQCRVECKDECAVSREQL